MKSWTKQRKEKMNKDKLLKNNPALTMMYGEHLPKYSPKKKCNHCSGTGIRYTKGVNEERFCVCTFVKNACSNDVITIF